MSKLSLTVATALAILPAAALAQQPAQVTIDLLSYSFTPKPIHLAAGRPVTLTLVNRAGKGHDFTAREFFAASRITAGAAPEGEVELHPGETRSLTLIPARGTYKVHCGHFMHAALGMTDRIIVD